MTDLLQYLHEGYFQEPVLDIEQLKGDGSARTIHRITGTGHTSIGVHGSNVAENRAFISFTATFLSHGLNVPHIFAASPDASAYILTDLGDTTLHDWLLARRGNGPWHVALTAMYRKVLRQLPRFQVAAGRDIDYSSCYQHAEFGRESMLFDLRYFRDMFLRPFLGPEPGPEALERDFDALVTILLREKREHFLYRDFQSRNIMIVDSEPWFIDYQSGRRGALQYDVASLLNDARAEIPFEVRGELIGAYLESLAEHIPVDPDAWREAYEGFALIRILQALGAFGNLGLRQGKAFFRESIPYGLRNLRHFLGASTLPEEFPALGEMLRELAEKTEPSHFPGDIEG